MGRVLVLAVLACVFGLATRVHALPPYLLDCAFDGHRLGLRMRAVPAPALSPAAERTAAQYTRVPRGPSVAASPQFEVAAGPAGSTSRLSRAFGGESSHQRSYSCRASPHTLASVVGDNVAPDAAVLLPGDVLLSLNGQPVDELVARVRANWSQAAAVAPPERVGGHSAGTSADDLAVPVAEARIGHEGAEDGTTTAGAVASTGLQHATASPRSLADLRDVLESLPRPLRATFLRVPRPVAQETLWWPGIRASTMVSEAAAAHASAQSDTATAVPRGSDGRGAGDVEAGRGGWALLGRDEVVGAAHGTRLPLSVSR